MTSAPDASTVAAQRRELEMLVPGEDAPDLDEATKITNRPVPCPVCKAPWPYPRKVEYREIQDIPHSIPPTTRAMVIASENSRRPYQERMFQEMTYHRHCPVMGTRLTDDFQFLHEDGRVLTAKDELSSPGYARLVTLNSWHMSLCKATVFMCVSAMNIQSNAQLCLSAVAEEGEWDLKAFGIFWFVLLMLTVGLAALEARWEWQIKSSPSVGDLIERCSWVDQWSAFAALVMLKFFLMPVTVRDLPILLHPWKSVQQFAAFKMENTRAYVVGYHSKEMFSVDNHAGQEYTIPVQLLTNILVLLMKGHIGYKKFHDGGVNESFTLFFSCAISICAVFLLSLKIYNVFRDRRAFRMQLDHLLRSEAALERNQAKKLLAMHFHVSVDEENHMTTLGLLNVNANLLEDHEKCKACGRSERDRKAVLVEAPARL